MTLYSLPGSMQVHYAPVNARAESENTHSMKPEHEAVIKEMQRLAAARYQIIQAKNSAESALSQTERQITQTAATNAVIAWKATPQFAKLAEAARTTHEAYLQMETKLSSLVSDQVPVGSFWAINMKPNWRAEKSMHLIVVTDVGSDGTVYFQRVCAKGEPSIKVFRDRAEEFFAAVIEQLPPTDPRIAKTVRTMVARRMNGQRLDGKRK